MSKLDEKLSASVKPARTKATQAKTAAEPAPAKAPAGTVPRRPGKRQTADSVNSAVDLNAASPPLFPERIWPD